MRSAPPSALDLRALAAALPARRDRAKVMGAFNGAPLGVACFSRHPRWERHAFDDELLLVLDGELDLTLLTNDGPVEETLRPGALTVVPKGVWHSPRPRGEVRLVFINSPEGTEVSHRTDPRSAVVGS